MRVLITVDGVTRNLKEWARVTGVPRATISMRLAKGWEPVRAVTTPRQVHHGKHTSPEYRAWRKMRARCSDPGDNNWKNYGARGIRVCERWESFPSFYADMGPRPSARHSLERKNNEQGVAVRPLSPRRSCQGRSNRRNNRRLTFQGQTLTMAEWAERLGLSYAMIQTRAQRGWTDEEILSIPSIPRPKRHRGRYAA